ncbi:MAG: FtsX-like permease family protein [Vicinamibacterales bacterium]
MPIIAGQLLPESREGPESVLVNQTFARTFFPGVDPVGRRIKRGDEVLTVAGIVPDVRHAGPERPAESEVFFSYDRAPGARLGLAVLAAPSQDSERLAGIVRNEIRALDPVLPVGEMRTLDHRTATVTASRRFQLWLVTGFAAFAFVLAALGLYASIAYTVNASRREIAVRMALGANESLIRNLYVRKGLVVCAIGLAVGAVASLWGGQYIQGLLFGVRPFDPVSGGTAAGVILASGLIASFLPALSASKTDPNKILRFD